MAIREYSVMDVLDIYKTSPLAFLGYLFKLLHYKISCSALNMREADKLIDKRQAAAILKLSPLLHGLCEDINCQNNSQALQIAPSFDGAILKHKSCT